MNNIINGNICDEEYESKNYGKFLVTGFISSQRVNIKFVETGRARYMLGLAKISKQRFRRAIKTRYRVITSNRCVAPT
jgi:hypothetical protein